MFFSSFPSDVTVASTRCLSTVCSHLCFDISIFFVLFQPLITVCSSNTDNVNTGNTQSGTWRACNHWFPLCTELDKSNLSARERKSEERWDALRAGQQELITGQSCRYGSLTMRRCDWSVDTNINTSIFSDICWSHFAILPMMHHLAPGAESCIS